MAKVTHVKRAQQRYATVPVLDEDGSPKRTPVMGRDGEQKVTKRGRPVFMDVTVADKSQPLPNHTCGKCGKEIKVGDPYKHTSPRSGPYGGRTLIRCEECPTWHVWEYSSSLSARLSEVAYNFDQVVDGATSQDEIQEGLNEAAEAVREIAQEKEESAQNIEDGFQHETQMSQDLRDTAEQLESWADEIENADVPDYPEPEEQDCDECGGEGTVTNPALAEIAQEITKQQAVVKRWQLRAAYLEAIPQSMRLGGDLAQARENRRKHEATLDALDRKLEDTEATVECEECSGGGTIDPDEPSDDQIDEWREEARDATSIVNEPPV